MTVELKLSIVTVCRNNPSELARTLSSIASYKNNPTVEWIVVDGSENTECKDSTISYLSPRDKYLFGSDAGPYDAMNKGLEIAQGNYIWFLNSGDEAILSTEKALISSLCGADLYCFPVHILNSSGVELETTVRTSHGLRMAMGPHQGMLFKRDTLIGLGGFSLRYRVVSDYELILRMLATKAVIECHYSPIAKFFLGGTSSTRLKRVEELRLRKEWGMMTNWSYTLRRLYGVIS